MIEFRARRSALRYTYSRSVRVYSKRFFCLAMNSGVKKSLLAGFLAKDLCEVLKRWVAGAAIIFDNIIKFDK